jgi:ureidoglycolate lyase
MPLIHAAPLTAEAFAPFGDVLDATGEYRLINDRMCQRFHDRARLDFGPETSGAHPGISIFRAEARALPYSFDLIERHPQGSQAFLPMSADPFLVIVATSPAGFPYRRRAGHQLPPRHLARRSHAPLRPRPFRRDRPHRADPEP